MKTSSRYLPFASTFMGLAIAAVTAFASPALQGSVIFSESFNYTTGATLNGLNGGTGFATGSGSGWILNGAAGVNNLATISSKGLTYQFANGDTLSTAKSLRVQGSGSTVKDFATIKLDATYSGTEIYISFLVNATTWTTSNVIGLSLANATTAINYQTVVSNVGTSGPRWGVSVGAGSYGNSFSDTETAETHLIVARFYKDGGSIFNKAELWVDPTSTTKGTANVTATVGGGQISSFLYLGILNQAAVGADYNFGRVMAGTTWADVVAIPEPGAASLLFAGGALALVAKGLRRRSLKGSPRA